MSADAKYFNETSGEDLFAQLIILACQVLFRLFDGLFVNFGVKSGCHQACQNRDLKTFIDRENALPDLPLSCARPVPGDSRLSTGRKK
jgi:hypothetical protein